MPKEASISRNQSQPDDILLRFENITKIYSGTIALKKVSVHVHEGEVHGIIGKNGAGKTTLVGVMSGIVKPTRGDIFVNGRKYRSLSRIRARKEGIAIVTQEPEVIPEWTVAENLFMPDFVCRLKNQWVCWQEMFDRAQQILDKHQLHIGARDKLKDLSISQQQVLLVLKACYVDNARIIILDEVSTALSKKDQDHLYEIINDQTRQGKAIIFISHRLDEILQICDRVTVIRDGAAVDTESRASLDKNKLSAYIVGTGNQARVEDTPDGPPAIRGAGQASSEVVLTVDGLTKYGNFEDISFTLRRGEIVGLAGLRGSGRSELFQAMVGLDKPDAGRMDAGQGACRFSRPGQAFANGIAYLPENRDAEGLVDVLSVQDNLGLSTLHTLTRRGMINHSKERSLSRKLIDLLSIRTPTAATEVKNLSGGNRQKVLMGRILATQPRVYLLDEPTKGIDIAAKGDILDIIQNELVKTAGILLTSPGLEDLMAVCDRILILYKGRLCTEFKKSEFSEGELFLAIQGTPKGEIQPPAAVG